MPYFGEDMAKKKSKIVFVVQEITVTSVDIVGGNVIGVYTTMSQAKTAVILAKKRNKTNKNSKEETLYDIIMCPLDYLPEKQLDEYETVYEKALYDLIDKGLMEALVGEDGYFYYELTEEGRKMAKKLSKDGNETLIDNWLKKPDEEDDENDTNLGGE